MVHVSDALQLVIPAAAAHVKPRTAPLQVWFEEKGFGFVSPAEGGDDCYVHRTCENCCAAEPCRHGWLCRTALSDGQTLIQNSTVQYTAGSSVGSCVCVDLLVGVHLGSSKSSLLQREAQWNATKQKYTARSSSSVSVLPLLRCV